MTDVVPWGEWKPDVSAYKGDHSPAVTNVYPRGDGYGPVQSFVGLSDALAEICRGFFTAYDDDGTIKIFAGSASAELYLMANTDFSWSNVSLATYSALATTAQWQFTQFRTRVIAVQANDNPQSFVMGSSTDFADLNAAAPNSAYVTTVNQFVVLSGIAADPYTIQWSSRGDPTEWVPGTNEGDTQTFDDGGLVRGVAGGEFGLVFQDKVIRRMTYSPGSAVVFEFDRVSEDIGLLAPYSIIRARDYVFFLSTVGFMQYHPATGFKPIGKERVDRTFLADCDLNQPQLIIGTNDPETSRVLWAYKSNSGSTPGLFDRIITYDWALDRWAGFVNLSGEYIATSAVPGLTLDGLDAISTSIDALTTPLDEYATGFANHVAMCDSTHTIGLLSGNNLEAILETSDLSDGTRRQFVRGSRPICDSTNVFSSVGTRHRIADPPSFGQENQITSQGYAPHREEARVLRFRNRFPAADTWSFSIGVESDVTAVGER